MRLIRIESLWLEHMIVNKFSNGNSVVSITELTTDEDELKAVSFPAKPQPKFWVISCCCGWENQNSRTGLDWENDAALILQNVSWDLRNRVSSCFSIPKDPCLVQLALQEIGQFPTNTFGCIPKGMFFVKWSYTLSEPERIWPWRKFSLSLWWNVQRGKTPKATIQYLADQGRENAWTPSSQFCWK